MIAKGHSYTHPDLGSYSADRLSLVLSLSPARYAYKLVHDDQVLAFDYVGVPAGEAADDLFFDWVRANDVLRQTYGKVEALWCSSKYTLVPGNLFNEYQLEAYTRPLFAKEPGEIIKSAPAGDNVGVFAINEKLYYAVRSKFYEAAIGHQCTANLLRAQAMSSGSDRIFAFFYADFFQLVQFENGRLLFHNTFTFERDEEAVYHLVNFYERMKLSRQRVPLYTEGLPAASPLGILLSKYILRVEDLPATHGITLADHTFNSFLAKP